MSFFGDDFFGVELAGVELSGDDFFGGEVSCYPNLVVPSSLRTAHMVNQ